MHSIVRNQQVAVPVACCRADLPSAGDPAATHRVDVAHHVPGGSRGNRVQQLLGHSSPRMTMRYAHLAPEHFDGVLQVLEEAAGRTTGARDDDEKRAAGDD